MGNEVVSFHSSCLNFSSGSDVDVYWYLANGFIVIEKGGVHSPFLLSHRCVCHCTKGCGVLKSWESWIAAFLYSAQLYFAIPFRNISSCSLKSSLIAFMPRLSLFCFCWKPVLELICSNGEGGKKKKSCFQCKHKCAWLMLVLVSTSPMRKGREN